MNIDEIRNKISLGRAILFCGAGFSHGATNIKKKSPCSAKKLAREISKLGGFEESEDLMYASDRYLTEVKKYDALINLLRENFAICDVTKAHSNICSHPWRRIYTTNYDDCVEIAARKIYKDIECLTIDSAPFDFYRKTGNCVHINGSIYGLNEEKLRNGTIKLTQSSYLSSNSFESSDWYQPFKKDLQNANLIVFIGYSLYDIQIEKILFDYSYKDKTIFITTSSESPELVYRLSKYGSVVKDGVLKFGTNLGQFTSKTVSPSLAGSIVKYELGLKKEKSISDDQIRKFFITGEIDKAFYVDFLLNASKKKYMIKRYCFDPVIGHLSKGVNVIIHSSFANGKSVFLEQIKCKLTLNGKKVYELLGPEEFYVSDFDLITHDGEDIILVIDSFSKKLEFLDYVIAQNKPNVTLLIADKTGLYESFKDHLKNKTFYDFTVDYIDDDGEISQMISIINNLGGWGEKTSYSFPQKKKYIKEDCLAEISTILLDVFKSTQIKNFIEKELSSLLRSDSQKKAIAALCLLSAMDLPLSDILVCVISGNETIYDYKFKGTSGFKLFFRKIGSALYKSSPILCLNILRNFFLPDFLSSYLLQIAKTFNRLNRRWNRDFDTIFKSVLKFSFIEQIFPEINKETNLISYYGNLKNEVEWLQKDDHFWLQYGMAEMNAGHLDIAEKYLKAAYGLAHAKPRSYKTFDIDTQYGRLLLLRALNEINSKTIVEKITQANSILLNVPNDHYRDRQIVLYEKIYKTKFPLLNETERINVYKEFIKMKKSIEIIPNGSIKSWGRSSHDNILFFFENFCNEQKDLAYLVKQ